MKLRKLLSGLKGQAALVPTGQFWIYFSAAIFFNLGFSIFFFLFNLYLLGLGFNERTLGVIGSSMAVGTLCGTVPAGIALERFGLRWTLSFGITLACLASILRTIFLLPAAQIPLAVLSGFGLCVWGVCLSPAVANFTSEQQRQTGFSIMFASGIGVAGLGALAAGNLPAYFQKLAHAGLSTANSEKDTLFLAIAIASLSLLLIARLFLQTLTPRVQLLRPSSPFLSRFLPAMAIWSLVTGAFPPFASVFFVHHLGVSLKQMGSIFSLSQLVSFAAILLAPLIFRRIGPGNGIMLTQLSTALMLFSLSQVHTVLFAGWLYWGYMATQCMNEPGIYSLLMARIPPADRGGASSYTFFVSAGSQIIASTLVGSMILRFGYSSVLLGISALAAFAAYLFRSMATTDSTDPGNLESPALAVE